MLVHRKFVPSTKASHQKQKIIKNTQQGRLSCLLPDFICDKKNKCESELKKLEKKSSDEF